jgi:hypothetical protein
MNLTPAVLIGAMMLCLANTAKADSDTWVPSQSVHQRCAEYFAAAQWAQLGRRGGASLDFLLGQLGISQDPEISRAGVRAAYDDSRGRDRNFYYECLASLREEDIAKQADFKRVQGNWMCQVDGSADDTQLWLSYDNDGVYSIGTPYKDWRHGSFSVVGDFVVEHLNGDPNQETQRRIGRTDSGALTIQGLPCHTFKSPKK